MKEEEFNYITLNSGGRYIPNMRKYDLLILEKLEYMNKFKSRILHEVKCIPDIYIDIINDDRFNASAILSSTGNYYIGVNKGVIIKLEQEFNKVIWNEKFYKRINFVREEASYYKDLCFNYALEFLIAHEISHIRYGHLAFKQNYKNSSATLYEAYNYNTEEDNMLQQTLEMDADCCGIATVVNRLLIDVKNSISDNTKFRTININDVIEKGINDIDELLKPVNKDYSDMLEEYMQLEERLYCVSFAATYVNELLFNNKHNRVDLEGYSHPHPGIRQCYLQLTIINILMKQLDDISVNQYSEIILGAMFSVEEIYHQNLTKDKVTFAISIMQNGKNHIRNLSEKWKSVREQLLEFSFDELAPYEKF